MPQIIELPEGLDLSDFRFRPRSEHALRMVQPEALRVYLRKHGWTMCREGDRSVEYERDIYFVLVLKHTGLADYCRRVSEALETIAEAAGRTEFEVFCDVLATDPGGG